MEILQTIGIVILLCFVYHILHYQSKSTLSSRLHNDLTKLLEENMESIRKENQEKHDKLIALIKQSNDYQPPCYVDIKKGE